MPDRIPDLKVLYEQAEFNQFVRLIVYYYNNDWNLAQRKWSRSLGAEYAYLQGVLPPERILTSVVARETMRFAARYQAGERYKRKLFWRWQMGQ